jgi:predicted permease
MQWIGEAWRRLVFFFRRGQFQHELKEEMDDHVRMKAKDLTDEGMLPDQARNAARREFGNTLLLREESRDALGFRWLEALLQDIRYGVRQLRRNPGFTAIVVLTLALGIGATTAIFSVVNAVLLRPLPYPNSNRLVQVWSTNPHTNRWGDWVSYPDFVDWRSENKVFRGMAIYRTWLTNLSGGDHPEALFTVLASSNLFSVLGVPPMLGRAFLPVEDKPGRNRVVILSNGLWRSRFASNRKVVGAAVNINAQRYTVIGVMPPGFGFPAGLPEGIRADAWMPLGLDPDQNDRGSHNYRVVGRLERGVTVAQAQADMDAVAHNLAREYPADKSLGAKVAGLEENLTKEVRPALLMLFGAIGLLLLIACANIANLLLSKALARHGEIALRLAIGASRRRIVRQVVTESVLLSFLGGAAGLLFAFQSLQFFIRLAQDIPRLEETTLDPRVLTFASLISLVTGILFGIIPAFYGSRIDLSEALKQSGSRSLATSSRLRTVLVVTETALAFVLLVGSGLLIRSFFHLTHVELGFSPQNVMTGEVMLPTYKYRPPSRQAEFFENVVRRLRTVPGVNTAGASDSVPFLSNDTGDVQIQGGAEPTADGMWIQAERPRVTPGYFRAMGIPLLRGRTFTWADNEISAPVAIVSAMAARLYWPNEDAIGKRLSIEEESGRVVWRRVVGIVGDVRQDGLASNILPAVYAPLVQAPASFMVLVVRSQLRPEILADAVRRQVTAVDKDQPLFAVEQMKTVVSDSVSNNYFQMVMLGTFAAVALILAGIGIYGVTSHSVVQRTREIGIRVALGAQKGDLLKFVVGHGMMLALVGVGLGLVGALGLTRFMSSLLYGVRPADLVTFLAVSLALTCVTLLACYIPARRATKVDPMVALRYE